MDFWKLLCLHADGKLPYADGVRLYFYFNPGSPLTEFFKKEDRYSRKKIKECLDAKFEAFSHNKNTNEFKSFGVSKFKGKINLELLSEELRLEYARLSPIIRKMAALHARLYHCSNNAQRYEIALQIIELATERRFIFIRIDAYLSSGVDPVKKQEIVLPKQKVELPKNYEAEYELKLLRANRSKLKSNPRRIHDYNAICERIEYLTKNRYVIEQKSV
jgi:hypothetical protein